MLTRAFFGNFHNQYAKDETMNTLNKIATAVVLSLGIAVTVAAHPMGPHGMGAQAMPGPGMQGGMVPGGQGGPRHGMMGAMQQRMQMSQAAQQLMTAEERTTIQEKMRTAKTPEERQQIAAATRTEMQKRATEKGITLPDQIGPHRPGMPPGGAFASPEHRH